MDPITAAITSFSPANILLAGAAVITLVITIVGIDKIREMISGEMAEGYLEDGKLYRDYSEAELNEDNYYLRNEWTHDGWEETLTSAARESMDDYDRNEADRWGISYEGYMAGPQDDEDWDDFITRVQAEDAAKSNGG